MSFMNADSRGSYQPAGSRIQGPVSKWSLRQDLLLKLRHVNDASSRFLSLSSKSCLKLHLETGPRGTLSLQLSSTPRGSSARGPQPDSNLLLISAPDSQGSVIYRDTRNMRIALTWDLSTSPLCTETPGVSFSGNPPW